MRLLYIKLQMFLISSHILYEFYDLLYVLYNVEANIGGKKL